MSQLNPRPSSQLERPWHKPSSHERDTVRNKSGKAAESILKRPNISSPLVPESILDGGKQRALAIGLFVALMAWKLQTVLTASPSVSFDVTLRFLLVDGLAIWVLPVFRIPWLTFSRTTTLVAMLVLWSIDILLTSRFFSWAFILAAWRTVSNSELSLSGAKIKPRDLVSDAKSHLAARYVVNILPESTALLNPADSPFCIESGNVTVPIRLNGTEPIFLQVERTDFTGESVLLNYTKNDIKRMTVSRNREDKQHGSAPIIHLGLPVYLPGFYRLRQVIDSSRMHVRLYSTKTLVVQCPRAYLNVSSTSGADRCLGDSSQIPGIIVQGSPPLSVRYRRVVNSKESEFTVDSIQPDMFTKETKTLDWAKLHTMELAADATISSAGTWSYEIDSVTDSQGNSVKYDSQSNVKRGHFTKHQFVVHSRPTVNFRNCDSLNPVRLARGGQASLSLSLTGHGDKSIVIERESDGQQFVVQRDSLPIDSPGIYSIKSLHGQYCEGEILEPTSCLVYVPPEPSVDITFEESSDRCVGATGAFANVTLTGTPPFVLHYYIVENGNRILRQFSTSKSRDRIEFHPTRAGTYAYEFVQLSDSLYRDIPINFHMEQAVHVRARARFLGQSTKRTCSGDRVAFDVALQGLPPLDLEYELINPSGKRKQFSVKRIESDERFTIETPELKDGGRYTLSLVSIRDQRKCRTELHEDNVFVDVRRQRPTVSFMAVQDKMRIQTLEKNVVGLPLKLSGEAPWTVEYEFENEAGEKRPGKATVHKPNGEVLRVNGRGTYRILSVRDALCPGTVIQGQNEFVVDWIPRPTVALGPTPESRNRPQICQGVPDSLDLYLEGVAPFDIYYDVHGPKGIQQQKLHIAANHGALKMETALPGLYKYRITGVADGYYSKGPVSTAQSTIVFQQQVNGRPDAAIQVHNKHKQYRSCTNSNIDDPSFQGIPIKFSGQAPFSLTLNVRNEGSGEKKTHTLKIEEKDLNENRVANIRQVFKGLSLGRHTLSLVKIRDGSGCERSLESNDPELSVGMIVFDAPSLASSTGKNHFCVGDKLSFRLDGAPPFEVVYEFNGKRQTVLTPSPFVRTATSSGNLTFISIVDQTSNCMTSLTKMDPFIVHELPSVKSIGDRFDIHEGDQTELQFKFTGTPPFSFTYTRSEIDRGRVVAVESHSVTDVYDWDYSVLVSAQGEYNVVALQDAYCSVQVRQ